MDDDLRSIFDRTLGGVPLPSGDVTEVVRRGRTRRRLVTAVTVVGSILAAASAWAVVAIAPPASDAPRPAAPAPEGRDLLLVPDVFVGPQPDPALASERDIEEAQAVTVAFHALLLRLDDYTFDYLGAEREGDAWQVGFWDGAEAATMEGALESQLHVIDEARASLVAKQERLEAARRRLRAGARSAAEDRRQIRQRAARIAITMERLAAEIQELRAQAAAVERRLTGLPRRGGPWWIRLRVVLSDGDLVVDDAEASSAKTPDLDAVVGYREPAGAVDAWGTEYYDLRFRTGADGIVRADMRRFWTGPIPARYEERCTPEVTDAGGEVVWRGPGPLRKYKWTPPREQLRDGDRFSLVLTGYEGPTDGLRLEMKCLWREAHHIY